MLKHAYFKTVIDGVFCVDACVINRCGMRFNRDAWRVRLWTVITPQTLWWDREGDEVGHEISSTNVLSVECWLLKIGFHILAYVNFVQLQFFPNAGSSCNIIRQYVFTVILSVCTVLNMRVKFIFFHYY